MPGLDFDLLE